MADDLHDDWWVKDDVSDDKIISDNGKKLYIIFVVILIWIHTYTNLKLINILFYNKIILLYFENVSLIY